jgi:hypothetical protein
MPLADATTNRIAELAGVSIGSRYQYFDSKEAIGLCLLQQHLEDTSPVAGVATGEFSAQGFHSIAGACSHPSSATPSEFKLLLVSKRLN